QDTAAALVELPPAVPAAEAPVAPRRDLRPHCHRRRATANAVHPNIPPTAINGDAMSATQRSPDPLLARELTEPADLFVASQFDFGMKFVMFRDRPMVVVFAGRMSDRLARARARN
ncbi:MAG: hypothetical protein ACRYG8_47085, partial [Janthinobacterium lividum]